MGRSHIVTRNSGTLLGIVMLSIPFLGACVMHSFGQGTRADMHSRPAVDRQTATMVKEVQRDDVTATLEIPPLHVGREAKLIVKVRDSGSSAPIQEAHVSIAIFPLQGGAGNDPAYGNSTVTLLAKEGSNPGAYVVSHTFEKLGSYEVMAEVHAGFESGDQAPLVVSLRQEVFSEMDTMFQRARTPLFVLGIVGMRVMMGALML